VAWPTQSVPIVIDPANNDLDSTQTRNIIQQSIGEWNQVSPVQLVPSGQAASRISFSSDFSIYGSGVVGITELSFTPGGTIQRANIVLNDNYFFTGSQNFFGELFLGDVVSHELGHALGLSHSEVLNASMFYSHFPGQATLSPDDAAGVRHKYAPSAHGRISGTVKGGGGVGVLGVHVQAFSRRTGESIGAITDQSGNFTIGGLPLDDTYYLFTSPLRNRGALPDYFANAQVNFCPGTYVGSFFSGCDKESEGYPTPIELTSQRRSVSVGTVTINCGLKTALEYNTEKLRTAFTPVTVHDFARDQRTEAAFVGFFKAVSNFNWSSSDLLEVDLRGYPSPVNKHLKLHLIGQKLGSQLQYEVSVERDGVITGPVTWQYSQLTKTYENDIEVVLPLSAQASRNLFQVRVRARRLSNTEVMQSFPSSDQFSSGRQLPYLLISSISESVSGSLVPVLGNMELNLSDNESCLDAPFTYAVARARSTDTTSNTAGQAAAGAGCGTIEPPDDGPGPPGATLLIGFLLALLGSSVLKRGKNFLS
jgi:hypothetical protein